MYGSSQAASCLYDIVFIVCFQLHAPVQVLLDVKSVFLIIIRRVLVVRVLCKVILIGKEWSHPSKLQDTLAAIHDSNFVSRQQVFAELLVVHAVARAVASGIRSVKGINGFLAQGLRKFLQCGRLRSAEEDLGVHVADDGIGIVLVDCLQLGPCLQHQAG